MDNLDGYTRDDQYINGIIDNTEDINKKLFENDKLRNYFNIEISKYMNDYNSFVMTKCQKELQLVNQLKVEMNNTGKINNNYNSALMNLEICTDGRSKNFEFMSTLSQIAYNMVYYQENYCIEDCNNSKEIKKEKCIESCIGHSYYADKAFDRVIYSLIKGENHNH